MSELRLYIPSRWSDLTGKQLVYVASVITFMRGKYDLLIPALMEFTGLRVCKEIDPPNGGKWFRHKTVKNPFILDDDQITLMANKLEFLMETDECKPLKWIRGARARHPRLYDATFEEYLMLENYFFAYSQTYQVRYMECMMAIAYRLPWQKWNSDKIEKRANWFRQVKQEKKVSMYLWYLGFRSHVRKRCPNLFSGAGTSQPDARRYINSLIHSLNNGDITLNDRLLQQPVWYALDEMEERARVANELEQKKAK